MRARPRRRPRLPEHLRFETEIQQDVARIYRSCGCTVYSTSSRRRGRTANSAGIPDLIVFQPCRGRMWYHETKAEDGRLSREQKEFIGRAAECGVIVLVGGTEEAREFLSATNFGGSNGVR